MGRAFEYRRAAKEARWDKMSKVFPKLAKAITVAAKDGGCDPDMNPKLRAAIAAAKAENMPKDNIDAAIKRANGKDSADIKTIFYDGKAAHGVQIIVECATDNPTRTVAIAKMAEKFCQVAALALCLQERAFLSLKSQAQISKRSSLSSLIMV